jgi:hypothetical protein
MAPEGPPSADVCAYVPRRDSICAISASSLSARSSSHSRSSCAVIAVPPIAASSRDRFWSGPDGVALGPPGPRPDTPYGGGLAGLTRPMPRSPLPVPRPRPPRLEWGPNPRILPLLIVRLLSSRIGSAPLNRRPAAPTYPLRTPPPPGPGSESIQNPLPLPVSGPSPRGPVPSKSGIEISPSFVLLSLPPFTQRACPHRSLTP